MDELVSQFVRDMKLVSGLNRQRVADVWGHVSGAGRYTLSTTYERGCGYNKRRSLIVRTEGIILILLF